jgi:hypothetical protein
MPSRLSIPTGKAGNDKPTVVFSEAEVRAFEAYRAKPSGSLPPRYLDWIMCGRPAADKPARRLDPR